ncbi:hypothetical protein JK159_03890 [Weissella minor]|uniref:hypothetical protein n=1 Tax=Weissella minor TaxID=1620 RepID=UPI001BB03ABE|nr:hypothetical protein [Weissella minor]MBS0949520.1 hypothetical protein [Weissella minor]
MDLLNQLSKKINAMPDLPTKISKATIDANYAFGIYNLGGSKVIEEDMAGNQVKLIPVEIAYRSNDNTQAMNMLTRISNMLENITELETDGSYSYVSIDVQPQGFDTGAAINNEAVFIIDFSVQIETKLERKPRFYRKEEL